MTRAADPFDAVRAIARTLPGVEEGVSWGTAALKVNGKMVACIATNKSAEPGSLVVRIPIPERDDMIAADPDTYYLTDHYVPYPSVLVRLSRIHRDALRDLLTLAVRYVKATGRRKSTTPRRVATKSRTRART